MRLAAGIVVGAALLMAPGAVHAQSAEPSIGKVRAYCAEWDKTDFSKLEDPFLAGYCLGLVQAFRDGMTIGMASTLSFFKENVGFSGPDRRTGYERYCPPVDVTNQHVAGVFMAWSSGNPQYYHLPYAIGFYEAFKQEWPCDQPASAGQPVIESETPGGAPAK
jgi:hypothetical protein